MGELLGGTIEFGDEVYGMAAFPVASYPVQHLMFLAEEWSIYPYDEDNKLFEFDEFGVLAKFQLEAALITGFELASPT